RTPPSPPRTGGWSGCCDERMPPGRRTSSTQEVIRERPGGRAPVFVVRLRCRVLRVLRRGGLPVGRVLPVRDGGARRGHGPAPCPRRLTAAADSRGSSTP